MLGDLGEDAAPDPGAGGASRSPTRESEAGLSLLPFEGGACSNPDTSHLGGRVLSRPPVGLAIGRRRQANRTTPPGRRGDRLRSLEHPACQLARAHRAHTRLATAGERCPATCPSLSPAKSGGPQRTAGESQPRALRRRRLGSAQPARPEAPSPPPVMQEGALVNSPPSSAAAGTPPPAPQAQTEWEAQVHLLPEEGICRLPGRLRIQPALWSQEDVLHWLRWAEQEYALERTGRHCFQMNGRALCILTKDDFRHRAPGSGDVLYELLQYIRTQRQALVCRPFFGAIFGQKTPEQQPPGTVQGDPRPSKVVVWKGLLQQPPDLRLSSSLSHLDVSSLAKWPLGREEPFSLPQCAEPDCRPEGVCPFPARPQVPIDGKLADCRLLWDYVYQLLSDARYEPYIKWEDKDAKVFRVVDPNGLARLWGNHKNRENMTYEKMSRALRHYYKLNIIKKEPGQKLLFRFLKTPGKTVRDQGSCLEPLERQGQDSTDFKEEML
ncbi:transcription factor ETV7 [Tenrec ecaudatus]|uniref:transcription factor ETV7 n=1 Tax=Tenrec ecaudatus TaxID=94439 RepID=UPI003F59C144